MQPQDYSQATRRLSWIRYLVVGGLLCCFAWAARLWLDHPFFGTIPIVGGLPRLGPPVDYILLAGLVLLLIPILITDGRTRRRWIFAWCALCFARCVWDRITWQPYLYQYGLMLLTIGWASPSKPRGQGRGKRRRSEARQAEQRRTLVELNILRLIVFSVYLWSGISKFNLTFVTKSMPGMLKLVLPESVFGVAQHFVITVPVIETLIAIGLLTRRFRNVSVVGALGMHVSILAMIGPWTRDNNRVIWPWNLAMMGFVVILFWRERDVSPVEILGRGAPLFQRFIFVSFILCPALSLVGMWHPYLSFKLYSGNEVLARVYLTQDAIDQLPETTRNQVQEKPEKQIAGYLDIWIWSDKELGAIAPPDAHTYRHVGRQMCQVLTQPGDMLLVIRSAPHWWTGEATYTRLTCRELRGEPASDR